MQIWREILTQESEGKSASELHIPYSEKSVYYYWRLASEKYWRLDPDHLQSAQKFILENGAKYHVMHLDIIAEPDTQVFAFQVTDFMSDWAVHTQELGMDSTCAFWNFVHTTRGYDA